VTWYFLDSRSPARGVYYGAVSVLIILKCCAGTGSSTTGAATAGTAAAEHVIACSLADKEPDKTVFYYTRELPLMCLIS
jgi:hypothetical protein